MIAFDNGPAHGDYVRYIDDLMKRAALAAPDVVASDGDMASGVAELLRGRSSVGPETRAAVQTAPVALRRPRAHADSQNGFATPVAASPASTAASAIASALMSGRVDRAAPSAAAVIKLAAILGGVLLVLAGLFWHGLDLAFVVGGIALIGWALRGRSARAPRTARRSA